MFRPLSAEGLEEVRAPMTESFWFLTGEDDPEGDAERPDLSGTPFDARDGYAPFQESMRGDRSRPQRAPSTDQKRVRRQIHRSGAQHTAFGPAYAETDWDDLHPHLKDMADNGEIHRGVGVNLPDDLHRFVHDESKPQHERAIALLNHLGGERGGGDHRYGLGMHWSLSSGVAEDFAEKMADHIADVNRGDHSDHDFSWGKHLDDGEKLAQHLHEHHGLSKAHDAGPQTLQQAHEHLHRGAPPMPGQQALFPEPPREPKANHHLEQEYWTPYGKPGTAIVLHTSIPPREDIEENPWGNPNAGGDVYNPMNHGEREVPIRSGASLPITGVSWKPMYTFQDDREDAEYTHHRFDEHEHREAAKKDAAYGEGAQQPIIPTEKLPFISQDEVRPESLLDKLLQPVHEEEGMPPAPRQPGGFDEPFQQQRFDQRRRFEDRARQDRQGPQPEPRSGPPASPGFAYRELADLIGPPDTVRRPQDARNPEHGPHQRMFQYFKDRWDKTFEPLGLTEQGKARSRRQTRARWSKVIGPPVCDHPNCPPWQHHENGYRPKYSSKTATVLNTQVERLNKGDQIRTPTGQTSEVKRLRPHETDSTLMYLDTDMGTSTVKRGTDFQVVPRNSQQQELPDIGNPMGGNSGELPGAGKTPGGGVGDTSSSPPGTCPNCGNVGTLHVQGSNYICSVCGFTVPAGGSPGNLMFTNQPSGHIPPRRKPGETPRAHVWASKYDTFDQGSQIARRARRVSGGDQ